MTNSKTLVNFNIPKTILFQFDQLCRLNGKPRSVIINDLIYSYILEAGLKLPARAKQIQAINAMLNPSSKTVYKGLAEDMSETHISSLKSASKSVLAADLKLSSNAVGDQ